MASTFFFLSVFPFWGIGENAAPNLLAGKRLRIFYANINSQNKKKEKLVQWLASGRADVVLLNEVTSDWKEALQKLKFTHPHMKAIVRENNFGMAVLSRFPIEVENILVDRENMIPALILATDETLFGLRVVLLHAHPPIGSYGSFIRDQYLETLAHRAADLDEPVLICGDFNTAPWSSLFRKFLKTSGFEYFRGAKIPNTWPNLAYLPSLPIDHCLTKGARIVKYSKGLDINSDHVPLEVEIVIESSGRATFQAQSAGL